VTRTAFEQELFGSALGLTTVHVNRTFHSLSTDKLIRTDGPFVTIVGFEALSPFSDFENSYLAKAPAPSGTGPIAPRKADRLNVGEPAVDPR
jgi:hypothetical protein